MATTEQPSRIQPLLTALMTASWLALASMSGACATADEAVDTDDDGGQGQGQNPTTTGTGGAPGTGGGPNLGTGGDPTTTGSTTTTGTGSTTTTGTGGQGGQPSTSTNDCCADNPTPGCQDPMVESCVCAIDNYCCSSAWDSVCVGIAENDCGHGCGGQGAGGQGGTGGQGGAGGNPPSQGCEQCILQQCGLQCILDGTCSQSIDLLVFDCLVFTCGQACWGWSPPGGCGSGSSGSGGCGSGSSGGGGAPPTSACCADTSTPGCAADPSVEACVCAQDAYCCNTAWDSVCVDEITQFNCGTCPP
ncbi:MAG: hypothetical protein RIF41_25095 [Polyangiaceae bacterium]